MKKLFLKEKKNILLIALIEVILTIFVFTNFFFENFLNITIEKEYIYTILISAILLVNLGYIIYFYSKIDDWNDINTKKTNFVLTNNIEDIFSFTESGVIFYDDDFNDIS